MSRLSCHANLPAQPEFGKTSIAVTLLSDFVMVNGFSDSGAEEPTLSGELREVCIRPQFLLFVGLHFILRNSKV